MEEFQFHNSENAVSGSGVAVGGACYAGTKASGAAC
jgi:hypothetical protein